MCESRDGPAYGGGADAYASSELHTLSAELRPLNEMMYAVSAGEQRVIHRLWKFVVISEIST